MSLDQSVAKRAAKIFCMLSSDHDGEVLTAANLLKKLLASEKLTHNDIAILIENGSQRLDAIKQSGVDTDAIFARGREAGRAEEALRQTVPPTYFDDNGRPRWKEIALFCLKHREHLRGQEIGFINQMASAAPHWKLSEKQMQWLVSIFVRLGGTNS